MIPHNTIESVGNKVYTNVSNDWQYIAKFLQMLKRRQAIKFNC